MSRRGYESWASSPAARATMLGNRRRDTRPELAIRSALHARGLRFRVQLPLPDRPRRSIDIAFTRRRLAVMVDGCFWHGCFWHGCFWHGCFWHGCLLQGSRPGANRAYWALKIERNQSRDLDTDAALGGAGWQVLRIWEHKPIDDAVAAVEERLRAIDDAAETTFRL